MIDDAFAVLPREAFSDVEWNTWGNNAHNVHEMIGGGSDWEYNPYVFTSNMSPELMEQVPQTMLLTTEFDIFRQGTERSREKYEEAGTLLDFGMIKGTTHGGSIFPGSTRFEAFYSCMNPLVNDFL